MSTPSKTLREAIVFARQIRQEARADILKRGSTKEEASMALAAITHTIAWIYGVEDNVVLIAITEGVDL